MSIITIFDGMGNKHNIDLSLLIKRKAIYGIFVKNRKLLMVRDKTSNKWEFPGGGIENNESNFESLKREFLEETNLNILDKNIFDNKKIYSCIELFFDVNSNQGWKTNRSYFLVSKTKGLLNKNGNNNDIKQVKFFSINELPFSEISETVKQVLNAFLNYTKKG